MPGWLMSLPWEGEGQKQRRVLLHGYGGGGGSEAFPEGPGSGNPYSADIAMPTGEVSPAETRQDPQGYRQSGDTSVRKGENHFILLVDSLKHGKLNDELLFVMITCGSEKEACCQFWQ